MAIVERSAGGDAPVIADDIYNVECISTKEVTVDNDAFGNPFKVEIRLRVLDAQDEATGEDVYLDPRVNKKFSEKSTLFRYAVAFGLDTSKSAIDTDALVGKRARALIQTPEEGGWPRVKDIMPLPKPVQRNAPRAAQKPVGESIEAWWTKVRQQGFTRQYVIDVAVNAFGGEPAELEPEQRQAVFEMLTAEEAPIP